MFETQSSGFGKVVVAVVVVVVIVVVVVVVVVIGLVPAGVGQS